MKRRTLIQGDCLEILPTMKPGCVDTLLTDPPYGTGFRQGYGRRNKKIINDFDMRVFAQSVPLVLKLLKKDAWFVFFCSPKRRYEVEVVCRGEGLTMREEVVWCKTRPGLGNSFRYQHETILFCSVGDPERHDIMASSVMFDLVPSNQGGTHERFHVHQKPVKLLTKLIRHTTPLEGVVLDPFMGSGSTGEACAHTGRRFVGIELDPEFFKISRTRLEVADARWPKSIDKVVNSCPRKTLWEHRTE